VLCQQIQHVAELAIDQVQVTGKARGKTGATSDCLGIAIDRPDRAGRSLQESRGVATAAERAIEIYAAAARGEQPDASTGAGASADDLVAPAGDGPVSDGPTGDGAGGESGRAARLPRRIPGSGLRDGLANAGHNQRDLPPDAP